MDPTLRNEEFNEAIDSPSYRARRILLPAMAYIIGWGEPTQVLRAYCLLNIVAWMALGILLLHWLPPGSFMNFAKWFTCMFSMGVLESVRYSLTDLPAVVLMLTAIYLIEKDRWKLSAISQILAVFSKETSILNVVSLLEYEPGGGGTRVNSSRVLRVIIIAFLSVFFFAIWMNYVNYRFPFAAHVKGNMGLPFVGIIQTAYAAISEIFSGNFSDRFVFRMIAMGGLSCQIVYLVRHRLYANPLWRFGASFGVLFLMLGESVWWGYWAACRVALPVTIAFCILYTPKNTKWFYPVLIGTNFAMIHGLIRWY